MRLLKSLRVAITMPGETRFLPESRFVSLKCTTFIPEHISCYEGGELGLHQRAPRLGGAPAAAVPSGAALCSQSPRGASTRHCAGRLDPSKRSINLRAARPTMAVYVG